MSRQSLHFGSLRRVALLTLPVVLLCACASAKPAPAPAATPDSGPSIAELSAQAAVSATAAAQESAARRAAATPERQRRWSSGRSVQALRELLLTPRDLPADYQPRTPPTDIDIGSRLGIRGIGSVHMEVVGYAISRPKGGRGTLEVALVYGSDAEGRPLDLRGSLGAMLQSMAAQLGSSGFTSEPLANGPSLGDESQTLKLTSPTAGGGYAIGFRRGSTLAVLVSMEAPPPSGLTELIALATQQDQKLGSSTY